MNFPPEYTTAQVMMTLSALAAFSPSPRPSGETLISQRDRIFTAIRTQLEGGQLAAGAHWQIVWLGLTEDRANLAYIALNAPAASLALVLRGTIGGSPIDTAEDLDVGTLLPFADGGGGQISQGSMEAFTEIVKVVDPATGVSLDEQLLLLLNQFESLTLYVTGHSLGGAMATTLALYLDKRPWPNPPAAIQVYTFAGPTAGDAEFAARFNTVFPRLGKNPKRGFAGVWNQYDVVPNAWWNLVREQGYLKPVIDFFPDPPGPRKSAEEEALVQAMYKKTKGNVYVRLAVNLPLNEKYETNCGTNHNHSIDCWIAELVFQHANNTYLGLLLNEVGQSAPPIPALTPVVTSLSPAQGPYDGIPVTINGSNFTEDCVVDFGVYPAKATKFLSAQQLLAVAPPGAGIVNVTVTNIYGTSATSVATACYDTPPYNPSAPVQFTYVPPS